jgi:hypothetical protein
MVIITVPHIEYSSEVTDPFYLRCQVDLYCREQSVLENLSQAIGGYIVIMSYDIRKYIYVYMSDDHMLTIGRDNVLHGLWPLHVEVSICTCHCVKCIVTSKCRCEV